MKIGIVTFWQSKDNYGQILQCWALQQFLMKQGHTPFLIRYDFIRNQRKPSFLRYLRIFLIYPIIQKLWYIIRKKINSKSEKYYEEKNERRHFDDFIENHILCSEIIYKNLSELRSMPPCADCYLTGSDQVWAQLLNYEDNKTFFLSFGDKRIRRIAYAPSFAMKEYPCYLLPELKQALSLLDFVSVREQSGCHICKSVGINAVNVLDPTLLLCKSDYIRKFIKHSVSQECVYIYSINIASADEIRWEELKKYVDKLKNRIVITPASGYLLGKELFGEMDYVYATIQEWLSYICYSKLVVTTSFHGVVFCILFETPFIYIPLKGKYSEGNSRITNLLKELELEDRVLNDNVTYEEIANLKINWAAVHFKVSDMKHKSISFLKDALQ